MNSIQSASSTDNYGLCSYPVILAAPPLTRPYESVTIVTTKITARRGAVAARWAHNPKVSGSNPLAATNQKARLPKYGSRAFPMVQCT
jgi:hypothetical protein